MTINENRSVMTHPSSWRYRFPPPTVVPRQALIHEHLQGVVRERFGRNPKLHTAKSASKTGSSTIFSAACTMRSRTAAIANGTRSLAARLGDQHPPRRQRSPALLPQFVGQLVEQPGPPRTARPRPR